MCIFACMKLFQEREIEEEDDEEQLTPKLRFALQRLRTFPLSTQVTTLQEPRAVQAFTGKRGR